MVTYTELGRWAHSTLGVLAAAILASLLIAGASAGRSSGVEFRWPKSAIAAASRAAPARWGRAPPVPASSGPSRNPSGIWKKRGYSRLNTTDG